MSSQRLHHHETKTLPRGANGHAMFPATPNRPLTAQEQAALDADPSIESCFIEQDGICQVITTHQAISLIVWCVGRTDRPEPELWGYAATQEEASELAMLARTYIMFAQAVLHQESDVSQEVFEAAVKGYQADRAARAKNANPFGVPLPALTGDLPLN